MHDALFLAALPYGLRGEWHPAEAIVLAKLIKLALWAGFTSLVWREFRRFL